MFKIFKSLKKIFKILKSTDKKLSNIDKKLSNIDKKLSNIHKIRTIYLYNESVIQEKTEIPTVITT